MIRFDGLIERAGKLPAKECRDSYTNPLYVALHSHSHSQSLLPTTKIQSAASPVLRLVHNVRIDS